MAKLKNFEDLFEHQLKDIYSAEKQLINSLPKVRDEASDKQLKEAFAEHLEETKEHKNRLDEIGDELEIDLSGETCQAMKGLIKEAESFMSEDTSKEIRDAGIIADAQRVEHYEISAYGTVVEYAKALGYNNIAKTLKKTLKEESAADKKLNKIAIDNINKKANAVA